MQDPGCVAARLTLAEAVLLDEGPREALALLDGAAPAGREGAHWRAHRALALLQLNEDAAAQLELGVVAPPYGDAAILISWARCNLALHAGRTDEAAQEAAHMDTLAADKAGMLYEHRVIAHYNLARYHHRAGRTRSAFDHWAAGHRLLARLQPFSRSGHAAFIDASIALYRSYRLHPASSGQRRSGSVFIVGLPRSGTTLTEQILAAHTNVHGAGERVALPRLMQRFGPPLSAEAMTHTTALDSPALNEIAEAYLTELHALAPDARYVVDKYAGQCTLLGFIATLLPGARIILCRRDPRDVALSIFQLRFSGTTHTPIIRPIWVGISASTSV